MTVIQLTAMQYILKPFPSLRIKGNGLELLNPVIGVTTLK